MDFSLVAIEQSSGVPENWNYEKSVTKVRQLIYKWKNLTIELLNELWVAREILSQNASIKPRSATGTFVPVDKNWDTYCRDINSSRQVINRWLKRWDINQSIKPAELPKSLFSIIYADPPWEYEFSKSKSRAIESHYKTMSLQDICDLPIPTDSDAILFLWATNPKIREALQVVEAWGFEYRTNMVWVKDKIGMGYYVRGQHELLLISRKGKLPPPDEANRVSSVINAPRLDHSRKPDTVYQIIENMYPHQKYIELFARNKRPGWVNWGAEIGAE